ncbi:MAG: hypothetical protein ACPGVD_05730, partial [Flavobacteriales bacterium]
KNRVVENIIILSVILIGLPLFVFACVGLMFSIFYAFENESILVFFVSLLGILGYFGLCNFFFRRYEGNLKITFIFLICGLLSLIGFSFWTETSIIEIFDFIFNFDEMPANLMLIWFVIVSAYFTTAIGRKLYKKILKEKAN